MNSTRAWRRSCVVILFLLTLTYQAYGQAVFRPEIYNVLGEKKSSALFHLGRFQVHGVLGLHTGYDSNVLFEENGANSDFTYDIIPGIDIIRKTERLELMGSYRFKLRDNLEYDVQDYQSHTFSGTVDWEFARRLALIVRDDFEKTADPADAELLDRIGRWTNQGRVGIRYRTPAEDLETTLSYVNIYQEFDSPLQGLGFFHNKVIVTSRVNVNSSFRFLPKSVLSGSVEYGDTSFHQEGGTVGGNLANAQNSDSRGISATLGLSSVLSRKITYQLTGGYSYLEFDRGPNGHQVLGQVDLNYFPSQKLTIDLGYSRQLKTSTFTNFYREHQMRGNIIYRFTPKADFHTKHTASFLDYSGPNGTTTGENRSDFVYQGLFGMMYQWTPWLSTILDYQSIYRDSNATALTSPTRTASFLKHVVTFSLDIYY